MKKRIHLIYSTIIIASLASLFLIVGCATAPPTQPAPVGCADFTGTWNTSQGPVELFQSGCSVEGVFPSPLRFHTLRGMVSGNSLEFDWQGPLGSGRGVITINETLDAFSGTWGHGESGAGGTIEGWKGAWPE
jgi:hypothetical protein